MNTPSCGACLRFYSGLIPICSNPALYKGKYNKQYTLFDCVFLIVGVYR